MEDLQLGLRIGPVSQSGTASYQNGSLLAQSRGVRVQVQALV